MNEVRVFDGRGNLKRIIPVAEVLAISDKELSKALGFGGGARVVKFKTYTCLRCRKSFESNATQGADYCKSCRKIPYRFRKRNLENEERNEN